MPNTSDQSHKVLVKRILIIQISLLAVISALVIVNWKVPGAFGFDWVVFLLGCLGASIAMERRIKREPQLIEALSDSKISTFMPLLYGGLMAGIAYLLFMSGILTGKQGDGLLASNLFPDFSPPPNEVNPEGVGVEEFMALKPSSIMDLGKLWTWAFMAGYSESFVAGILDQLERRVDESTDRDQKRNNDDEDRSAGTTSGQP